MLPEVGSSWPPTSVAAAFDQVRRDQAWLNGDLPAIRSMIGQADGPATSRWQHNGGIAGAATRAFMGAPKRSRVAIAQHVPLPYQLCKASANILMGTPPQFQLAAEDRENETASAALSAILGSDRFASDSHRAAIFCAALGWVFARVVWDRNISRRPWIEFVDADMGYAQWSHGRVESIDFWDELPDPSGKDRVVWRLIQHHTPGRIDYALYAGSRDNIGHMRPFGDHADAAYLAEIVDENSGISTGTTRMTAVLIPNIEGNPAWRKNSQLRHLGMSDIRMGGTIWGDINKLWSEFMHEIDSGRARLLISDELMQTRGPGSGLLFNWFQDVFPVAAGGNADEKPTIEQVQFNIRVKEYLAALEKAERKALDAVGISPITIGSDVTGDNVITATEVAARSRVTKDTWSGKARMWRTGLSEIATAALDIDAMLNGGEPLVNPVTVGLTDPVQENELDRITAAGTMRDKRIASIEHVVDRLHPEWTSEEREIEVERIRSEDSPASDPLEFLRSDEAAL